MRKTSGCFTILTNNKNQVLLIKRKDYPLWDLPGGTLNKNESLSTCAIRETFEESGYHTALSYLVGTYQRPRFCDIQYIYHGSIIGGTPLLDGPETKEIKWFPLYRLPFNLILNRRTQIRHYRDGRRELHITLKDRHPLLLLFAIKNFIKNIES